MHACLDVQGSRFVLPRPGNTKGSELLKPAQNLQQESESHVAARAPKPEPLGARAGAGRRNPLDACGGLWLRRGSALRKFYVSVAVLLPSSCLRFPLRDDSLDLT